MQNKSQNAWDSKRTPGEAREFRGISQCEMAKMLGIPVKTYAKWERFPEKMPVSVAVAFASAVSISLDHIFFSSKSTISGVLSSAKQERAERKRGICLLCGDDLTESGTRIAPVENVFAGGEPWGEGGVCGICLSICAADRGVRKAFRAAMAKRGAGSRLPAQEPVAFARFLAETLGSDKKEEK